MINLNQNCRALYLSKNTDPRIETEWQHSSYNLLWVLFKSLLLYWLLCFLLLMFLFIISTLKDRNWYFHFLCEETEVRRGGIIFSKSQYCKWQSQDSYCICFYAKKCSSVSITPSPLKEIAVISCFLTKDSTNPYGIIFMQIQKSTSWMHCGKLGAKGVYLGKQHKLNLSPHSLSQPGL